MNAQERIEALEAEFNEKMKALKAEMRQEFPRIDDEYWIVESTGEIDNGTWEGNDIDNEFLAVGNVFKTWEQAEFAVEKLKVEAELRKFSRPFKCGEINRYIYLDTNSDCLALAGLSYSQYQGTIYFESEDKANEAIELVGIDRIKKYIFGMED